ncbi:hypothetical protein [Blattabacterium cuenoti]|uniref:Lipoprotein n=1 Tax=Blattabacterium cuenoti STAT TaxID=1457030 RepID=A0A224AIE9_9FLAO|nr:hypothetical protein [Blattabacterium cuenoti]BBA17133.1 hypothetical protein STAT_197 [Blattabacterium cuenoti STAT]
MNTSFRFLILTISIALGFISTSCNDDMTMNNDASGGEKTESSVPDSTTTTTTDTDVASSKTPSEEDTSTSINSKYPPYTDEEIDKINPEDLDNEIKKVRTKVIKLDTETKMHLGEFHLLVNRQKRLLNEIKVRRMIMRSKPKGSEEEMEAKNDLEDRRKYGKEKLQLIKDKNEFLYKLTRRLVLEKDKEWDLRMKKEYLLKKLKERKEKEEEKN